MKVFWSPTYVVDDGFDTVAKSEEIAVGLDADPIGGVELVEPDFGLDWEDLSTIHTYRYLEALRTGRPVRLAESAGFTWSEAYAASVLASTDGMMSAAAAILNGERVAGTLSAGLHHAAPATGAGFCAVNGLAAAALHLAEMGARVLIVDLDAHFGGGTDAVLRRSVSGRADLVRHLDVSVSSFDHYYARSIDDITRKVSLAGAYLPMVENLLEIIRPIEGFDFILYNAGVDPHEDDVVGGLKGITADVLRQRDALVFDWAASEGAPVAWCLAGGYGALAPGLHRQTIEEAARVS